MITKYIVKDDNIFLYENEDLVCTLPNNSDNLKLAKLYNDQVFIDKDIMKSSKESDYYNDYCKKGAKYSLICIIILVISNLLQLPLVNLLAFYLTGLNVIAFMISKGRLRRSDDRLSYLKKIKNDIENKIVEIENSKSEERVDNLQLTFSDEQIVEDHKNWVTNYGDTYDYSSDIDTIRNNKVLIKK